jgi:hypothetical protein
MASSASKCPHCGANQRSNIRFCTACGQRLPEPARKPAPARQKVRTLLILAALFLIILCLLCGTLTILGSLGTPDGTQPVTGERSHFVIFVPFRDSRGPKAFHPGKEV